MALVLTTLAAYKVHAQISGTAQDARLTTLLTVAESALMRRTGRSFVQADYTHTFDGNGGETLQLRDWPVASVASVTQTFPGGSTAVLDSTTYRVNGGKGLLSRTLIERARFARQTSQSWLADTDSNPGFGNPYIWTEGYQNFTVVYNAGFATIPDDLAYTIHRMADWMAASAGDDPTIQSESIGAFSVTKAKDSGMPSELAMLIRNWEER